MVFRKGVLPAAQSEPSDVSLLCPNSSSPYVPQDDSTSVSVPEPSKLSRSSAWYNSSRRNEVAYIPKYDHSRLPSHTGLKVSTKGDMIVQKVEEHVTFLLLVAYDASCDCT